MKSLILCVAIALLVGLSSVSLARTSSKVKGNKSPKALTGVIARVQARNLFLTVGPQDDPKEKEIVIVESTVITLDGKPATMDDLAPGMNATITPPVGDPKHLDVTTPGKPKTKGKSKKGSS